MKDHDCFIPVPGLVSQLKLEKNSIKTIYFWWQKVNTLPEIIILMNKIVNDC